MKKSPLYYRSGMGTPAKGSPVPLWGVGVKVAKQVGKHLIKNWKKYVAGELLYEGGTRVYDHYSKKSSEKKEKQITPGDKIMAVDPGDM